MQEFIGPMDFESTLVKIVDSALLDKAQVWRHPRIGSDFDVFELDYAFEPYTASSEKPLYLFEFKYSPSPTLADSTIYTQLARVTALMNANPKRDLRFVLVTNGKVRVNDVLGRANIFIFDEILSANDWQTKFESWLVSEFSKINRYPTY